MATEKTTGRKQRSAAGGGNGAGGDSTSGDTPLRTYNDPRSERRYEPKASPLAFVAVIAMSLGGLLVGAGTYAQWFRAEKLGPYEHAPLLLTAGAVLLIASAMLSGASSKSIRVGDAGIAREDGANEIERIEWRDLTRLERVGDALVASGPGTTITVPIKAHPQAAARIVAEAKARLPKFGDKLDAAGLDKLDDAQGEIVELEPAQVAGARCKKSDKIIAFEKDARLCGRCGEVYHKDSAPKVCLTCGAKLRV